MQLLILWNYSCLNSNDAIFLALSMWTLSYEEVKDRLEQYLKQQKVQESIAEYVETLKGKAKIERFSKEG